MTSSVNEVTLSLDLTLIRQWLLHQCLIQTIVMEKLNLVRCSLGQLLSVLGKAITSRIFSSPANSIAKRSSPKAIPPCGGSRNLMRLARNQIGLVLLLL